ncbi:MAG: hypothetical protein IJA71_05800, partial [Clostridia bacterium]|nr:hypothetical protein [Clostridia bacterium]
MKSRISCFKTALKKDLTRFAPAWGGYTLCLMMGLLLILDMVDALGPAQAFPGLLQVMPVIELFYGLIAAQLLFGDLCGSRMCYGLHTLPLRREGWFAAHTLSGLLFSLIPTALMTAVAVPLTFGHTLENGWQMALWFLLGANLEYLFFFGVGVLSMLLAANRFGAAILYAVLDFASILLYYVVDTVFIPMLYGFVSVEEPYVLFSPVVQMVEFDYIWVERFMVGTVRHGTYSLTENWWYLWTCAAAGCAALAGALVLYRRRDLERAGDLLAVKILEPVFQVVFSVVCATVFHFVAQGMFGYGENFTLLFIGLIAGWFFGRMLLKRTARVFGLRSWMGLGALTLAVAAVLLGAWLDVLGLEDWVPRADKVESVTLSQYRYSDHEKDLVLTDKEDIENILFIHEAALESRLEGERLLYDGQPVPTLEVDDLDWSRVQRSAAVFLTYRLESGATVTRYYYVWEHLPEGQLLERYYSTLKAVTAYEDPRWSPV